MIHQHRCGVKAYQGGSGRRAQWDTVGFGQHSLRPQFWISTDHLPSSVTERSQRVRVGFCDITGQTNERTMLASLVPSGVVCGNKVPTVTFPNDLSFDRLYLWLAIVNSVPFDWLLRRIVTTSVNYFVLRSVPFPGVNLDSLDGQLLVSAARELDELGRGDGGRDALWRVAELRAGIDAMVLLAYGESLPSLALMLEDFPLLDRSQPSLPGEPRSTITKDFLLLRAAQRLGEPAGELDDRVESARRMGGVAYVPSELGLSLMRNQLVESHG
jgi:hypothetical protein